MPTRMAKAAANPDAWVQQPTQVDAFVLQGGLDEVTPTLQVKPGPCRQAQNFEALVTGGYGRVGGYERVDGWRWPSDATVTLLPGTFVAAPTAGDTLSGRTSGARGEILAGHLLSGADGYLALTLVEGTFLPGEVVEVAGTAIGTVTTAVISTTRRLDAYYLALAADAYRAKILPVPGSGPVRGVVSANFGGAHTLYAWRDSLDGTETHLYKSDFAFSWQRLDLGAEVGFTSGSGASTAPPVEGATLTQGPNTATIKRVVWEAGSWAAGTATGRLLLTRPAPASVIAGAATVSGGFTLSLNGSETAIRFLPGGTFEFDPGNFAGQLATSRIYGADGVNRAFEFDGTLVVPIATGAAIDTPSHVKVHQHALVLSIGSSLMLSGPGTPYKFNSTDGGAEIAVGDTITGLLVLPGVQGSGALAIDARNSTSILYGTAASGSAPWDLKAFNTGVGGLPYTQQVIGDGYKLDDSGVTTLAAAQEYGNFLTGTLTFAQQTFLASKRGLAACSSVQRTKNQYRVFFTDGTALYVTLVNAGGRAPSSQNQKVIGAMPMRFPTAFHCAWNAETPTGEEVTYAGAATGGYVYLLDRGSSFDGAPIDGFLLLAPVFQKTPRLYKRYLRAAVELTTQSYAEFTVGYALGYGSTQLAQPIPATYTTNFPATPTWDAVHWDAFTWDGLTLSPTEIELLGTGETIQYAIHTSSKEWLPFTLNSLITHYRPRRGIR